MCSIEEKTAYSIRARKTRSGGKYASACESFDKREKKSQKHLQGKATVNLQRS